MDGGHTPLESLVRASYDPFNVPKGVGKSHPELVTFGGEIQKAIAAERVWKTTESPRQVNTIVATLEQANQAAEDTWAAYKSQTSFEKVVADPDPDTLRETKGIDESFLPKVVENSNQEEGERNAGRLGLDL